MKGVFLKEGKLSELKYFDPKVGNRERFRMVPKIIIGLGKKTIGELLTLRLKRDEKRLQNHWAKIAVLRGVTFELDKSLEYQGSLLNPNNPLGEKLRSNPELAKMLADKYKQGVEMVSEIYRRELENYVQARAEQISRERKKPLPAGEARVMLNEFILKELDETLNGDPVYREIMSAF